MFHFGWPPLFASNVAVLTSTSARERERYSAAGAQFGARAYMVWRFTLVGRNSVFYYGRPPLPPIVIPNILSPWPSPLPPRPPSLMARLRGNEVTLPRQGHVPRPELEFAAGGHDFRQNARACVVTNM